ncbi:putative signal transducing protein [Sphingomonas sp. CCH18-H6]|uniref:putative signal transducing protein n=2 Tax=unclassified Sphingomonas TaxID=196159 RepID=UPI000A7719DC
MNVPATPRPGALTGLIPRIIRWIETLGRRAAPPPGDEPPRLAELGRYDRMEAHIIIGRLEAEGIPAVTFDGEMSLGDGSALLIPVRVMIDADDMMAARRIVAAC